MKRVELKFTKGTKRGLRDLKMLELSYKGYLAVDMCATSEEVGYVYLKGENIEEEKVVIDLNESYKEQYMARLVNE